MKANFVLQTIIILLLPVQMQGFNLLLSFPLGANHACTHSSSQNASKMLPFEKELGKVIKESKLLEEDFQIKTVVIDAGHGGHDPGCLGGNSREKHLALGIALELSTMLKQTFPDIRVIMTRSTDVFIPLYERAAIANRNNADLFISIHCNFMPGRTRAKGTETYVMGLHTADHNLNVAKRENDAILLEDNYERNYDYDPNSPEGHIMLSMFQNVYLEQSILFAEKIESKFASVANRRSRGVKQAGFVVLKETTMPSVLIEAGFLSDRKEEQFLKSKKGQRTMANAILVAFAEYKRALEGGQAMDIAPIASKGYDPLPETYEVKTVTRKEVVIEDKFAAAPTQLKERALTPDFPRQRAYTEPIVEVESESKIISFSGEKVQEAQITPRNYNARPSYTSEEQRILEATFSEQALRNIQFHVQLAASPSPIDLDIPKWQNLGYLVEITKENGLYKYQARNFSNFQQANEARKLLQTKGFKDAFVVSYKDGQRIPIETAKKTLGIR
ncbi:MAG: N-acetylmuramoyl-L-alanine amidase [Saprospiraceae bacterium]|nr:N-acetylmuramoyl-L-alanine amidase [Saprospiraceae bacterium]